MADRLVQFELAHSRLVNQPILFIRFVLGASSTDWWTLLLVKAYALENH